MPLYTYQCADHGEFATWESMSASDKPQPCPACDTPAPRALAKPAVGSRGGEDSYAGGCGEGSCEMPSMGGGACCRGGACMH